MAQRDYRKYKRLYKPDAEQREVNHNVDDLLAIQQIELDRGNYSRPPETIVFSDHRQLQQKPREKGRNEKSKTRQKKRPEMMMTAPDQLNRLAILLAHGWKNMVTGRWRLVIPHPFSTQPTRTAN